MSKHVVFIDANVPGIRTIDLAVKRGYQTTFIRTGYKMYTETEAVCRIITSASNVISIGSSISRSEVEWALRIAGALAPIDAVITQYEGCVDVVAEVCSHLGLPFTSSVAVAAARDKARARALIGAAGLRSAQSFVVSTPADAEEAASRINGSVIVKPRTGYDSLLAYEAHTPAEAAGRAQELLEGIERMPLPLQDQLRKGILVEELLVGPLVSAELGVRDNQFYRFMVSGRPRARENEAIEMGATMPADLSDNLKTQCFEYAEAVVETLGLDLGIFHIEMIVTDHGPAWVEVNPRLMGGVMPGMYKNLTGDDIEEHLLDLHLGLPIVVPSAKTSGFITSRKLLPRTDGRLAETIDLAWVSEVPNLIDFDPYRVEPGAEVKRLDVLARYQIRAKTLQEANSAADALLTQFENEVGIELIR